MKKAFAAIFFFLIVLHYGAMAMPGSEKHTAPEDTAAKSAAAPADLPETDNTSKPARRIEPVGIDKHVASKEQGINSWKDLPGGVLVLLGFVALFLVFVSVTMFLILYLRIVKTRRADKAKQASDGFEAFITDIIFPDEMPEPGIIFTQAQLHKIEDFRKSWLADPFNRQIVLNNLLQLHKNLSGETAEQLQEMYTLFGFEKDSMKRLMSSKWHIKAKAINEIEQMQYQPAYKQIYRLINNPNETLRSEAQMAIVSLKKKNQLSFLDNLYAEMSDWQQLNLLDRLNQVKSFIVPDLYPYLDGANESVTSLCVKIIQYFNVVEQADYLLNLLPDTRESIRIEAVKALAFLHVETALEEMHSRYASETQPVKIEILTAAGILGTTEDIPWLQHEAASDDLGISQAAGQSINKLQLAA